MRNLLWFIAAILLIAWGIGLIGYGMGGYIHILLGLASVAIILRLEDPIFRSSPSQLIIFKISKEEN